MLEGILRAKDKLGKIVDSDGSTPCFTLLLRSDDQIKHFYGDYNAILESNRDFLLKLESGGDELGWHPHFWRQVSPNGIWFQEYRDIGWQADMLKHAYNSYQMVLPGRAKTVRMGWCYHNNTTMGTLDKLGVETDISAFPGLRIDPRGQVNEGANYYDWSISPYRPFKPSINDYRRPAEDSEKSYSILEAPNFVARSLLWGIFNGLVLFKKMRDPRQLIYAIMRKSFISTITGKPVLFRPILRQISRDVKLHGRVIYITPLHPDELIENIHPVYSLENMERNISAIMELGNSIGAEIKYIRGRQIKEIFDDCNLDSLESQP